MLVRTYNRRIDKDVARQGTVFLLETLPELAPDGARFPAAKPVVHRIPAPEVRWQVTPRYPCPGEIEHCLDKHPVTEHRRAAGAGFEGGEDGLKFGPCLVREQQTYRHQVSSITDFLEETYAQIVNSSTRPSTGAQLSGRGGVA